MPDAIIVVIILAVACLLLCAILYTLVQIDNTLGLLLGRLARLTPDAERPIARPPEGSPHA
jgi:hypothetical protein